MPIYKMPGKKDGKQQYRVKYNYTDKNGNRKQLSKCVYGSTEAKMVEMELKQSANSCQTVSKITINELYDEYIKSKSNEVRMSTLEKSKSILRNNVLPALGNVHLDRLSSPILQKWKNEISSQDKKIKTKQNVYKEFRAMLNYAVKMDYIITNPLLKIGNFKDAYDFDTPENKLQYYTAEQFKQFISAAENHLDSLVDYGFYTFFCIAFYTGMRKGEINALRWCDIDGSSLSVNRSVTQKVKGQGYMFSPPKNASSARTLQLPKQLIDILTKQKELQQKNSNKWSEEFLVCGGTKCLSDTAISNRNILYASEAALPAIKIHGFRHSHASVLINKGINIMEVSRRLGHSDVNITWKIYAHLYPQEEKRAIKILESI